MIILYVQLNFSVQSINSSDLDQITTLVIYILVQVFFQNDSKIEKIEEEYEKEELLQKVDLKFKRIELRVMDLQYYLFDEKKLKDLKQWYTRK